MNKIKTEINQETWTDKDNPNKIEIMNNRTKKRWECTTKWIKHKYPSQKLINNLWLKKKWTLSLKRERCRVENNFYEISKQNSVS